VIGFATAPFWQTAAKACAVKNRGEAVPTSGRLARIRFLDHHTTVIRLEHEGRSYVEHVPKEVFWLVSFILIEAAIIDGRSLRVPNWLTFHFLVGGLAFAFWKGGSSLLLTSLLGAGVGLVSLLPLYAIGGMGAGDVKLMAGLGAWVGPWLTLWAFLSSAVAGAVIAAGMIAYSGELYRHLAMMHTIGHEVLTIRRPVALSEIAARRKPTMTLLPYAIPIAVGTIAFFAWSGMLA
jgi:prepilin peptidase CpaA